MAVTDAELQETGAVQVGGPRIAPPVLPVVVDDAR
jgi:hypothetical protein